MQINCTTDMEILHAVDNPEKEVRLVRRQRKILRMATAHIKAIVMDSFSGRLGES